MAHGISLRYKWVILAAVVLVALLAVGLIDAYRYQLPTWWPSSLGRPPAAATIKTGPAPVKLLERFHPGDGLGVLGSNGLRASIEPSFGNARYQIDIAPDGLRLPGSPNVRYRILADQGAVEEYRLFASYEDVREVIDMFDARSDGWLGATGLGLDGTSVIAERVATGRVSYGDSNARPSEDPLNPIAGLGADLNRLLLAYGPTGRVPRLVDWHILPANHAEAPCHGGDYNLPDPDGIGVGEDACARSRRRPSR